MDSILTSIKKSLGIGEDDVSFDTDIVMSINTAVASLTQMGVGPPNGFRIEDKTAEWSDFLGTAIDLESVKSFIYLKVKLLFDPPSSSALIDSINRVLGELEFRIYVCVDNAAAT